jgi:hypothetical protein
MTSARSSAGNAASSPNTFGSGMNPPARTPITVPTFQATNMIEVVIQ